MKYVILVIVVILCGYIGYGLSSYYTNRTKFFKNLELLFEKLNLEINFSQSKLIQIMQNFSTQNKEVKKLISNFVNCLEYDLEIKTDVLFKDIKILNNEEKNVINIFFLSLGKFDVINQTKQLQGQKEQLNLLYKTAEQEAKKFAPLYLKMGIIAGLLLALLLL
ncbi:MAG: hypothetical protein PHQ62_01555 [Clostridia bacterium]|nr:hypothetical protein [Clostridia bacterium]